MNVRQHWQIWQFCDGKAGHENQSRGLIEALVRLQPMATTVLSPLPFAKALAGLIYGDSCDWRDLPNPDLLVGAGHRTHLSLLAARRARGGKAVVLMRPSLPLRLFDLCLIPEHDAPPLRPNVLATRGVLNRIQLSPTLASDQGLFLVGGPSTHFGWDNSTLYQQIAILVATTPTIRWTLTTSRRTPSSFLEGLPTIFDHKLTVVPVTQTSPDWLPEQLAQARYTWVTADSVSMVYEALTAGTTVGVLELPQQCPSRVSRGLDRLATESWVTFFSDWQRNQQLCQPDQLFNEAERCARWIVERWLV